MARIPRWTQKIFASGAMNNGVFGSAADNSKILSNSLEDIQSLPAYVSGWISAVIGTKKFPALEEFQSLHYMTTTQICYMLQEGISEYDADTTYYQNSIVKKTGTFELYGSITDDNTGNPLTDSLNWKFLVDLSGSAIIPNASTSERGIIMLATSSDVVSGNTDKAVTPNLLKNFGFVTGDGKDHWGVDLQSGWIWADGKTIGNTLSNATNRANPDTEALFKYLYRSFPTYPLYNSSGVLVSRGSSADADWLANRAIAVPDKRGRASYGKDNMGGTAAGRLTGQTGGINGNDLGGSGGAETVTLSSSQIPSVGVSVSVSVPYMASGSGSGQLNVGSGNLGSPSQYISGFGSGSTSGGGGPHNNVPPGIVCNYVIKL